MVIIAFLIIVSLCPFWYKMLKGVEEIYEEALIEDILNERKNQR